MAEGTHVEWTHRPGTIPTTHVITMGCHRRSPGCGMARWEGDLTGRCYAIGETARQQHLPGRDALVAYNEDGVLDWTGKITILPDRLRTPLKWRDPHTVFVNSLAELFDDAVPDAFIAAYWCVMWATSKDVRTNPAADGRDRRPVSTYLILGKNHARMLAWLRAWGDQDRRMRMLEEAHQQGWIDDADLRCGPWMPAILDNAWIGVSVENQQWADIRLPALMLMPAARRYASCEPLLGPFDATPYLRPWPGYCQVCGHTLNPPQSTVCLFCDANPDRDRAAHAPHLDMVIVGGESKTGCRPAHPDWFRDLRDQTVEAGRAFFFKQHGDWADPEQFDTTGMDEGVLNEAGRLMTVWPDGRWQLGRAGEPGDGSVRVWKVGKKRAGSELDGKVWRQFPGDPK